LDHPLPELAQTAVGKPGLRPSHRRVITFVAVKGRTGANRQLQPTERLRSAGGLSSRYAFRHREGPFGNLWWIMTRVENVSAEEEARRYGEKQYLDALAYFQSTDFFGSAKT
jgi:hypothetical protein